MAMTKAGEDTTNNNDEDERRMKEGRSWRKEQEHEYKRWSAKVCCLSLIQENRGLPFVGETLQFMAAINSSKGVYEFVHARRLRYEKCFKTKLFGETHVFISSTESAKVIVNKENEGGKFSKRYIKSIAELVGADSLLCAAQQHHKLIRSHLFSFFSTDSLSSFVQLFDSLVLEATPTWTCGSVVVIQDETLKIVKEALRKASVVQWLPRVALEDCEIEGFKIKKGWNINIDARSIHHDPTLQNDPDVFNPSRFPVESKLYSFLAFGMGGRTCLGKNMAKAMMLVFLHRFITNYKWKVIDSDSSIQNRALFTKIKSGYPLRLISKKDAKNKTM
ncbi:Abscisic acid 8'-hydroxylase 2 [Glycine max]|nr:taxoid 7-beta-hydroxylase [Glycine max]KAH1244318.1 Abscisic acid 8'-hydroxylase 2 [Glycine max]|eukprot:XP_003527685.1 taxoid 7-beta-hydroxylase [Glycine max]